MKCKSQAKRKNSTATTKRQARTKGRNHDSALLGYEGVLEAIDDFSPEDRQKLAEALQVVFQWAAKGARTQTGRAVKSPLEIIGRRMVAAAWVLSPDYIDGSPSLTTLARKLGYSKYTLSILASEFSRRFGITNRPQSHGSGKRKT